MKWLKDICQTTYHAQLPLYPQVSPPPNHRPSSTNELSLFRIEKYLNCLKLFFKNHKITSQSTTDTCSNKSLQGLGSEVHFFGPHFLRRNIAELLFPVAVFHIGSQQISSLDLNHWHNIGERARWLLRKSFTLEQLAFSSHLTTNFTQLIELQRKCPPKAHWHKCKTGWLSDLHFVFVVLGCNAADPPTATQCT